MLIKQSLSLPRNLALRTFGKLLIVFSAKGNLLVIPKLKHEIKEYFFYKIRQKAPVSRALAQL